LVAAGAWAIVAEAISVTVVYGPIEAVAITATWPILIATVPYPLFAAGLLLLSRTTGRRGPVDALDATIIALATFLVLWGFAVNEVLTISPRTASIGVVLPFGALLAFAMAVKVALGGGLRDPATAVLVVIVAVALSVTLVNLVLGVGSNALRTNAATHLLLTAYGVLVGVVGVLPSLTRPRPRAEVASGDMSRARLVVFSLIVLLPLLAWWESSFGPFGRDQLPAVFVTVSVAALFLVLLVIRLALLARLAQRRADELAASVATQRRLEEQLRYQATHDSLTDLANRTVLTDRLTRSLQSEQSASAAILMLDLDGFKFVNDSYGHAIGDELLVQTASRLRATAPDGATLARLGGDEFVILCENADRTAADHLAHRVVDALHAPYELDGQRLRVSASVGVVVVNRDEILSSAQILRDADSALYEAKAAGRDRAVVRERHLHG